MPMIGQCGPVSASVEFFWVLEPGQGVHKPTPYWGTNSLTVARPRFIAGIIPVGGKSRGWIMAEWTAEELLRFDIAFALKKVTIPGFRKALTEDDPTKGICARRTGAGQPPAAVATAQLEALSQPALLDRPGDSLGTFLLLEFPLG